MAWDSFLTRWHQDNPAPVTEQRSVVPEPSRGVTERRDFDLKSIEAQRLFVFGGNSNNSGVLVNDFTVLSSTPFYGAMRYISEGVAMLDRKVKKHENGRYYDDHDHPVSYLFKRRPHPNYTWFDLIAAWICNAMLGNGYLRIHWDEFTARPLFLEHIPSRFVYPEYDSSGFLWYRVTGELDGLPISELIPYTDILHLKGLSLDGLLGTRTTLAHKTAHGAALAADNYTQSIFDKAAFPSVAISTPETMDASEVATMEQNLISRLGGASKAGTPLVLDGGKSVNYLQWSPIDVALEAVKHLTVEQVSQITKIPRDLLGLDNKGTLGATIQRSKDLYVHALQPWVEKIQEEINTKLFREDEIVLGQSRFEFDASLYISMSPKEQVEMFEIAIRSMQMTPNEAREQRGMDPMEGGDELYGDINTIPLKNLVEVAFAKYLSSVGEGDRAAAANDKNSSTSNTDNELKTQPSK